MKDIRYPIIAGLICISQWGCIKNDGENQHLDPNNQYTFDFMSAKEGSSWHYGVKNGVSYMRYARGKDSVVLGATYSYYERKDDQALGFQPEYFGRNGTSYLTLIDLDGNERNYINYLFWKDGAAVGASWDNTARVASPVGNVNVLVASKVAENNLTMMVNGNTLNDVVHVHSDLKGGPLSIDLGTLDLWFQKGIGIIREEADIDVLGQYQTRHTDSLLDYHLVP